MTNLIIKLTNRGYSPLEAYELVRKLAIIEELEQWARTVPPMEAEEEQGWTSGKGRVLQISQNSETPDDAADKIRNIIDMVPSPQTPRDRGRLRALNEALDTMAKSGGPEGHTMGMDSPPAATPGIMPGNNPVPRADGTDSLTPGSGSKTPYDGGVGTGRMASADWWRSYSQD